jgi:hypothetical protein
MNSATDYRKQADACRRAASLSKGQHPTPYLIDLAKDYELRAAQLEARFAGDTPGADKLRDSK